MKSQKFLLVILLLQIISISPAWGKPDPKKLKPPPSLPRPLYEVHTKAIIGGSDASMKKVIWDLLKYGTQLHLNALDTIVPILQELRRNMTELLHSGKQMGRREDFIRENKLLEQLEGKLEKTRTLQSRQQNITRETETNLRHLKAYMEKAFFNQILLLEQGQVQPENSYEDQLYIIWLTRQNQTDALVHFLRNIHPPGRRGDAYKYFFKVFNRRGLPILDPYCTVCKISDMNTDELMPLLNHLVDILSPVYLQIARDVFTESFVDNPNHLVDSTVGYIFSSGTKDVRNEHYRCVVLNHNNTGLEISKTDFYVPHHDWKFLSLDRDGHFLWIHGGQNVAVGILAGINGTEYSVQVVPYQPDVVKKNPLFRWHLNLHYIHQGIYIVNRNLGLMMGTKNSEITLVPYIPTIDSLWWIRDENSNQTDIFE